MILQLFLNTSKWTRNKAKHFNYFSNTIIREQNINFISDLILDKVKPYYSVFKINAAWMLSKKR